ncbi:unnamed protein product [Symbiodinium sp. CCMP2456]|nr:unnamed protein product [Symbiodinium sp. CCMP2456]
MTRHARDAKNRMGARAWSMTIPPRQEAIVTLLFWKAKLEGLDMDNLYVDLGKSWEYTAFRDDGLLPAHRNCMSMPVIGSVLLAVLAYGDFGSTRGHWRQGVVPTPTSQATTVPFVIEHESDSETAAESDVVMPDEGHDQ